MAMQICYSFHMESDSSSSSDSDYFICIGPKYVELMAIAPISGDEVRNDL